MYRKGLFCSHKIGFYSYAQRTIFFYIFSDFLPLPAHDVLDTSNIQSSSSPFVHLHNPKFQINLRNKILTSSNRSKKPTNYVKHFPTPIPIMHITETYRNPTKHPNANDHHLLSFFTNPKIHLKNMGTSTTYNKHDTIVMHPHRSSNSGYDVMQHHHHLSTREQNDKKFPSTWRKPYHNIMEIGENDDLILRLPFYIFFVFFFLNFILVDSTLHNCLLKTYDFFFYIKPIF